MAGCFITLTLGAALNGGGCRGCWLFGPVGEFASRTVVIEMPKRLDHWKNS